MVSLASSRTLHCAVAKLELLLLESVVFIGQGGSDGSGYLKENLSFLGCG